MTADEERSRPQARAIGRAGATRRAVLAGSVASGVVIAAGSARAQALLGAGDTMPPAPQDGTSDIFHGVTVPDPFRPLEDGTRTDVRAWVEAQDQQGRAYLESLPSRRSIRKFFDSLLDYPRVGIPQQHGTRYFSYFNDGLANQSSYGMQEPLAAPRRTVIDASTLSSDGTVAITGAFPDRRGARVAYLLSEAGSDRQTLRVRDVDSGRDLPVRIGSCKHTSVTWFFNNTGFFYTRYPNENDPPDWDRHSHIVCTHPLGPAPANERVIFRLPDRRDVYLRVQASYDARLLKITAWIGTSEKAGYYVAPFDDLSQFTEIIAPGVTAFYPIGNVGVTHYAITGLDAPKGRLIRIDQSDPKPERWHTVIAESELALDFAAVFDSRLVVKHLDAVNSHISIYDLVGRKLSTLDLGGPVRYSSIIAAWVRLGGIYATAVIRGGGEFGQSWHDGGRLANKQHSFDDFIGAAEWLIANRYTRPDRLGINGASNGGLLVLSCMLQRPELYGAVVAGVPVADMLRYKLFTFGSNWIPEYGDPASEASFKTLIGYSPVHNVRPGVKYPPLLVLTADSDDRVVPAHAYKFVATLSGQSPTSEVRLKVETRAGHGFGNALNKTLDRATDTLAFLCQKLGGPVLELPKISS
jgi:prolyl oligopeptidase PreP (S9A serine peptidase family)